MAKNRVADPLEIVLQEIIYSEKSYTPHSRPYPIYPGR